MRDLDRRGRRIRLPLGSATTNVLGGCLLVTLLAAGDCTPITSGAGVRIPFACRAGAVCGDFFLGVSYSNAPFDEIRRSLIVFAAAVRADCWGFDR